jgi:hypothetical protein
MKFLSKLVEYFEKGLQILNLFQPTIQMVDNKAGMITQTVSKDMNEIYLVLADVEKEALALGLKGPDKLKMAVPLVEDIILRSASLANHKVANPDLFKQGVEKLTSGAADIVNSLHTDGIESVNKKG